MVGRRQRQRASGRDRRIDATGRGDVSGLVHVQVEMQPGTGGRVHQGVDAEQVDLSSGEVGRSRLSDSEEVRCPGPALLARSRLATSFCSARSGFSGSQPRCTCADRFPSRGPFALS